MINSALKIKTITYITIIGLLLGSVTLWLNTPDLFNYFNQAFCVH